jgi:hypothetical protein
MVGLCVPDSGSLGTLHGERVPDLTFLGTFVWWSGDYFVSLRCNPQLPTKDYIPLMHKVLTVYRLSGLFVFVSVVGVDDEKEQDVDIGDVVTGA